MMHRTKVTLLENQYSIRRLESSDSESFDQFFDIYVEALPVGERKPKANIESLLFRTDYSIFVATDQASVVAFAIVFASQNTPVALLEYMATKKGLRNTGLGKRLFVHALESVGNRVMLVEVDSERERAADNEIRVRRKNFYIRNGCRQIEGLDYLMPQVSDAKPPVMDLLYHAGGDEIDITEQSLKIWLSTLYAEVYNRDKKDRAIAEMLDAWRAADKRTCDGGVV